MEATSASSRRRQRWPLLAVTVGVCCSVELLAVSARSAPPSVASAAAPGSTVEIWVRQPGTYGAGADPAPQNLRKLRLDAMPLQQIHLFDAQYQARHRYRGVPLSELIKQYAPAAGLDLVLLHCRNGMIVPLPFRNLQIMERLDPFIALEMLQEDADTAVPGGFPSIVKSIDNIVYADVKQVSFTGNKLVVAESWHPDQAPGVDPAVSPWMQADSVSGIEFAQAAAYYRQFTPTAAAHPGVAIYKQSCQYCHGVRKVGARFGWDYVDPIALHTYRSDGKRLYYHVKFRDQTVGRSFMMPALKHISESDARHLWTWMQAVSNNSMPPYRP